VVIEEARKVRLILSLRFNLLSGRTKVKVVWAFKKSHLLFHFDLLHSKVICP